MGSTLLVCGPGATEHSHHFDADATLEEFRRWYEERLIADGWTLLAFGDRRAGRRGGPPGEERRRRPPAPAV